VPAFSYVETMVLQRYMPRPSLSKPPGAARRKSATGPTTPDAAAGIDEKPVLTPLPLPRSYFLLTMHKLTSEALGEGEEGAGVLERLEKYFVRQSVDEGVKLWRRNDPPHMAILLEQGPALDDTGDWIDRQGESRDSNRGGGREKGGVVAWVSLSLDRLRILRG
jgi:hypothetical protein